MTTFTRPLPENDLLRRYGGPLLPSTTGEAMWAAVSDPRLRLTQLGFQQAEIDRETRGERIPDPFGSDEVSDAIYDEQFDTSKLSELVEPDSLNEEYGYLGLKFEEPTRRKVAELLAEQKREDLIRQDVLSRAPGGFVGTGAVLTASLAGAIIDPLNIATAFIPIVGEARYAIWAAKVGKTAARVGRGTIEGVVGNAMIEPGTFMLSRSQQLDYDMTDALLNVGLGGLIGGGLHATGGKIGDLMSSQTPEVREATLRGAVAQAAQGKTVDVEPVLPRAEVRADNFPEIIIHTSPAHMTKHVEFEAAKGGDLAAARRLVADVVKEERVAELAGVDNPVFVPVYREGGNAIPRAFAEELADRMGGDVSLDIRMRDQAKRRGKTGRDRTAGRPRFEGNVDPGRNYVIVDDHATMGGTLQALRQHIEDGGGRVRAASTLSASKGSRTLAVTSDTLEQLRERLGPDTAVFMERKLGRPLESLTEKEALRILSTPMDSMAAIAGGKREGLEKIADTGSAIGERSIQIRLKVEQHVEDLLSDLDTRAEAITVANSLLAGGRRALLEEIRRILKAPDKTETLVQWLVSRGGIKEFGGDLRNMGVTSRTRPGFINNKTGLDFDDAALAAWEAGFFPEHGSRPDINEFLDALDQEFNHAQPSVRQGGPEEDNFADLDRALDTLGLRLAVDSPEFMVDVVERVAQEPPFGQAPPVTRESVVDMLRRESAPERDATADFEASKRAEAESGDMSDISARAEADAIMEELEAMRAAGMIGDDLAAELEGASRMIEYAESMERAVKQAAVCGR